MLADVAATHIVDLIAADNCWRNVEFSGALFAGGLAEIMSNGTGGFDGGWGSIALIRPLIVGHDLPCPACDRSPELVYFGTDGDGLIVPSGWTGGFDVFGAMERMDGWDGPVRDKELKNRYGNLTWQLGAKLTSGRAIRHGIATPHQAGLYVTGATFINYDRPGMVAVTGAHRNCEPCPYMFVASQGSEVRWRNTRWLESNYRVRWRWENEAIFVDLDGTFADQPFCTQCTVLSNALVWDARALPECYPDFRYGWVCKPDVHFTAVYHGSRAG
jgi:hypothetical protein